jgi:hypothetical protein
MKKYEIYKTDSSTPVVVEADKVWVDEGHLMLSDTSGTAGVFAPGHWRWVRNLGEEATK